MMGIVPSLGTGGNFCSFSLPLSSNAQILVEVLPAQAQSVSVSGVTGPVQLNWQYLYRFTGLTLGS